MHAHPSAVGARGPPTSIKLGDAPHTKESILPLFSTGILRLASGTVTPMRLLLPILLLVLSAGRGAADTGTAMVVSGQSTNTVAEKLGDPTGEMRQGTHTLWLYPKGTVEFENGRVVRWDLLSEEAYAAEQVRRAQWAESRRRNTAVTSTNRSVTFPIAPPVASDEAEPRFYRPFVRPTYQDVLCYNNIPIVFETSKCTKFIMN